MPENTPTREMVESSVRAVFEAQAARFQEDVTRLVWEQLNAARPDAGSGNTIGLLEQVTANIERAGSQSDILNVLLEGTRPFASRVEVFLLRATSAIGWQGRGFRDNDALKLVTVDASAGLVQQVLVQRTSANAEAVQFDARFVAEAGQPFDARCALVPVSVRDKVVALLYADAGSEPGGVLEPHALQLLARFAGIWLELLALRKSTGFSIPATPAHESPTLAQELQPVPVVLQQIPDSSAMAANDVAANVVATSLSTATAAVPQAVSAPPVEEDELHRKARRFAKLLVEEIKLYNLPKVRDGKLHRNLYERLKDDIEKSRATYDQRYANTSVASAEYFTLELVRGLADGDATLFGSNFPR